MGQVAAGDAEQTTADPLDGAMGGEPLAAGSPPPDGQADDLLSQLAGAEIDRMLAEADVEPPPPAAIAVPPPVAAVASPAVEPPPATPAEVSPPPPPPVIPAAADLDAVLAQAVAAPTAAVPAGTIDLGEPLPRGSWLLSGLLRPLSLVNAPLDPYPDRVREAVGKVAVVTLVNAIAVLAYVVVFRRHGG